ncbi:predicted protein [Sparassis crispa]|uniref:Fungal-type protein kinase domain-containing protein n=1 Tax=Sparassis crispa TaxID=139825 RepID=A0A401H5F0_9APHY|nr:predicted protein [Sparassis crispa]GBE89666.1 predicted protein [Sparassis crispa]
MPVDEFLKFLPETDMSAMPPARQAFKDVPAEAKYRQQIIEPLIIAINGAGADIAKKSPPRCPGFVFVDTTSFGVNCRDVGSMVPHVSGLSEEVIDLVKPKSTIHNCLGYTDLYVEVQPSSGLDAFTDPTLGRNRSSHNFIPNVDGERIRTRADRGLGRNIACATEACAHQHRSFYFSVSLSGSRARLIRWDRAGMIVSESFDLRYNAEFLCTFLWRYAHASYSQRGYDPTVQPATKEEEKLFKESIRDHVKFQLDLSKRTSLVAAMEEHYQPGNVVAVTMVDDNSIKRRLLISRPVISPVSMTGRGTRAYWAVSADNSKGEMMFLKDTWRCNGRCQKEGEVLEDLHRAGVPNIPQLICHGDVLEQRPRVNRINEVERRKNGDIAGDRVLQCTQTDQFQHAHWVCKHKHDQAPYESMMGAINIEDNAKRRVHRNVSLGNIILSRNPNGVNAARHGYLFDWELSCLVTNEGEARDPAKVGTFRFMSQRSLSWRPEAQTIQDDMESLLWVVLYCSLLWLDHDLPPQILSKTMVDLFDQRRVYRNGDVMAGEGKFCNQLQREHTSRVHFLNPVIQQWLDAVMDFNSSFVVGQPRGATVAEIWKDPSKFNVFWQDFLGAHEMFNHDRISRTLKLPRAHRRSSSSSTTSSSFETDLDTISRASSPSRDCWLSLSSSTTSSAPQTAYPVPVIPPSRKRKATGEPVGEDPENMIKFLVPSVPRADYTGPITRSMAKRRQTEAQGSATGFLHLPGQPRYNPRCLRPSPAKINMTDFARQGPKSSRSKK